MPQPARPTPRRIASRRCMPRRAALLCVWMALCSTARATDAPLVDFDRDIRPLLVRRCTACHGSQESEAGLRLDRKADAYRGGNRGPALVPNDSQASRLIAFVTGVNDEKLLMPPEGDRLTSQEIDLLKAWIDQGAAWPEDGDSPGAAEEASDRASKHWSFQPLLATPPPAVQDRAWPTNPIDQFVLARLEALGVEPSPREEATTLLRRVTLDLTGLPPTPAEVAEFLADTSPLAYERVVDRLLASPHFGERWARHWLDLARYADSDGYEKDTARPHAWRYRNWVIDALNADLPFDQFTIQQLAGDLLTNAPLEARVATGFHRNTLTNREGGVDQEEYRVKATIDRVNTTGSVWLGLTLGCAQCHRHKYDPISQRDYYGLLAFFNSLQEVDVGAPLAADLAAYQQSRTEFERRRAPLVEELERYDREQLPPRQAAWEAKLADTARVNWRPLQTLSATSSAGARLTIQPDASILASDTNPPTDTYLVEARSPIGKFNAIRLEVMADASLPAMGPGRVAHGNFVLSEFDVRVARTNSTEPSARLEFSRALASFSQDGFPIASALDGDLATGWAVAPRFGQSHVGLFDVREAITLDDDAQLAIRIDQQHGLQHTLGKFRLSVALVEGPLALDDIPPEVDDALAVAREERTSRQLAVIADYYQHLDVDRAPRLKTLEEFDRQAPIDPATTTLAQTLRELPTPRETHIFVRGEFLNPGALVDRATPVVLTPLAPHDGVPSRLDLARWLVRPDHPLTSRVLVNRIWQRYFGRGLVATENDFGTQGEKPSHPELLDWLARDLIDSGWSVKHLHRTILLSSTYRQSSRARPDLQERDPLNTWLARQQRLRVEAEVVRDLALAASGLWTPKLGGPSVRPPQPAGIAELTYANSAKWIESEGQERFRRGLYTWFQRTSPYPMLMTFDAPDSNVTCTRRERSNTPLQALTMLNDPVLVECAQGLARRVLKEIPVSPADSDGSRDNLSRRLNHAFLLCLGRFPDRGELADLADLYAATLAKFEADPLAAEAIARTLPSPEQVTRAELGAWTIVSRTLLNLDEFLVRE